MGSRSSWLLAFPLLDRRQQEGAHKDASAEGYVNHVAESSGDGAAGKEPSPASPGEAIVFI